MTLFTVVTMLWLLLFLPLVLAQIPTDTFHSNDDRNITGPCFFNVSNTPYFSYKFTEPGNTTVTLQTLGDSVCELTVVAVAVVGMVVEGVAM